MSILLCKTTDIHDPGSRGFQLKINDRQTDIFIIHKDGQFYAYINSCPHTGASLEWNEHQFLDMDNYFIQCSNHHALFEINSGNCVSGPCVGQHLTAIDVYVEGCDLFVYRAE